MPKDERAKNFIQRRIEKWRTFVPSIEVPAPSMSQKHLSEHQKEVSELDDICAVIAGSKPAAFVLKGYPLPGRSIDDNTTIDYVEEMMIPWKVVKEIALEHGVKCVEIVPTPWDAEQAEKYGSDVLPTEMFFYRDDRQLEALNGALLLKKTNLNDGNRAFGKVLGYPDAAVESFVEKMALSVEDRIMITR